MLNTNFEDADSFAETAELAELLRSAAVEIQDQSSLQPSLEQYPEWVRQTLQWDVNSKVDRTLYSLNLQSAKTTIDAHPMFKHFGEFIQNCILNYQQECHAGLLMEDLMELPTVIKSYESAINKSFRQNIIENTNFPNPPEDGWITADNIYERFNDLIRTRIVCKFLDGPKWLSGRLKAHAEENGLGCYVKTHQRDGGYYAFHVYLRLSVPVLLLPDNPQDLNIYIEIQLTTQLQELLYDLTHPTYEELRIHPDTNPDDWKWDYGSQRFKLGYMGHTLHMLEALILELRDNQIGGHRNAE